jgi:fructoselysine-6-P-deglycase FrlB-like protein
MSIWMLEELSTQPTNWLEAAGAASQHGASLPQPGERVAIVGCGTSFFIAQAAARLREDRRLGETDAFAASEFPTHRRYDRYVAITRSGETTEVLDLLRGLPKGATTVAVTATLGLPVGDLVREVVALPFADERSVVQTRFATSALALLRAHFGESLEGVAGDGRRALSDPLPPSIGGHDHFVFLGRGWTVGLAHEAALKIREATGSWAESYPTMEYRHGPIAAATSNTLVWLLDGDRDGLADQVRATGASFRAGRLDPQAELVLVQRMALARAQQLGLDPDRPRHLSRAVVLPA